MIYSVNFLDMTEEINPFTVCKYLEQTDWKQFQFKRTGVKVYQKYINDVFEQVIVPMDKSFLDYKNTMFDAVKTIADTEKKTLEQIMLFLLNPNSDILKIRFEKKDVETGNILFDDAIKLFDNAKRLLAATALDVVNPKKIHYGRIDDSVQHFLNQCRFGQTEIGSYVVSIVCPFAELSEGEGYRQLSIFSDEERCAYSLTRKVTNKLIDNVVLIKHYIDEGDVDKLLYEEAGISSNFLEALNGLNLKDDNTLVEFTTEWSPTVKTNRSENYQVKVTNDYYEPIASVIGKIKEETNSRTEIVGRIKQLSAAPMVDDRIGGIITVAFVGEKNRVKSVSIHLNKEDYENAVEAHQHGKAVRVVGDLITKGKLKMENSIFSVID